MRYLVCVANDVCCRMALTLIRLCRARTCRPDKRSRRYPAKISNISPTPLHPSATLKSIRNSHILYG
ncbi:hypothetical protein FBQ69_16805 [Salmonella enterica]|nr:hypothetical protein [Salmonella enterica subsp. arizonae serovar 53:z4,z23,z32:-]EAW3493648.1 hypothetical protein [Salmonella enterica]EDX6772044.1 hypothetical protein [Salmonella enterica subsp. arizonae serovar 53:z4,z24:-]EAW6535360.1 hypothetical protein [Salmonella enterica]EBU3222034.1 hypothetical protein [Salmonella enterica]